MEASDIAKITFELIRLRDDQLQIKWEDDRCHFLREIDKLKSQLKYKELRERKFNSVSEDLQAQISAMRQSYVENYKGKTKVKVTRGLHERNPREYNNSLIDDNVRKECKKSTALGLSSAFNDVPGIEYPNFRQNSSNKENNVSKYVHINKPPTENQELGLPITHPGSNNPMNSKKDSSKILKRPRTSSDAVWNEAIFETSHQEPKSERCLSPSSTTTSNNKSDLVDTITSGWNSDLVRISKREALIANSPQKSLLSVVDSNKANGSHKPARLASAMGPQVLESSKKVSRRATICAISNNPASNTDLRSKPTSKSTPKYIDVVRNKEQRAMLPGHTCEQCVGYYDELRRQGLVTEDTLADLLTRCSRHKSMWVPPSTPSGFWDLTVRTPDDWTKVTCL